VSDEVKRINPRRAYQLTPEGLRRIVLGEAGGATAIQLAPQRTAAPKPKRLQGKPEGYLLVAAHADRGALDAPAQQAIAAAALLADASTAVVVVVFGELREDLSRFGADEVIALPECGDGRFQPDVELAVLEALVARYQPRHVLLPDNQVGDGDLGRRLAVHLRAEVATHVVELRADGVAALFRGGASIARRDLPRVILLDPETTDTTLPFVGKGERLHYDGEIVPSGAYTDLGLVDTDLAALPLEDADFVVSAGNGVTDLQTFEAVAKVFGAATGASRVAVDDGRFPRHKQVGATGKTVSASVYMAIGISGAVQHLQGIRACRHVIAINRDPASAIAKRADLTIIGDAQPVMEQLLEATRGRNWPGAETDDPL
jgi:electron transfer flavoprotein alpha subunit